LANVLFFANKKNFVALFVGLTRKKTVSTSARSDDISERKHEAKTFLKRGARAGMLPVKNPNLVPGTNSENLCQEPRYSFVPAQKDSPERYVRAIFYRMFAP